MRKVVVTGLGLLTSIGNNRKETWQNLINCKSGIKNIIHFQMLHDVRMSRIDDIHV